MFIADLGEDALIKRFFRPFATDLSDDVALLNLDAKEALLVSTDALQEDIHFLRANPAAWVARKALRANASDIVASGGRPRWFTLSLGLPRDLELAWLADFAGGLRRDVKALDIALIGGDTTAAAGQISIGITVLGTAQPQHRISRSGAQPGDWIAVTGFLGEAAIGLDVMVGRRRFSPEEDHRWSRRHYSPPYRGALGLALAERTIPTAMMDLSDGLAVDLPRLCHASGIGAVVELEHLPRSPKSRKAGLTSQQAFNAGEDYELLFTLKPERFEEAKALASASRTRLTVVGSCRRDKDIRILKNGLETKPRGGAWRHFR